MVTIHDYCSVLTLSSTVSQIDFSVGTVEGLFTDLTIVQTHHYHGQFIWSVAMKTSLMTYTSW